MAVVPRTLKQGSRELVVAVITDILGNDLSTATYQVAHVPWEDRTADPAGYPWEEPHSSSDSPTASVRRVVRLVTAPAVTAKTRYAVFVKVTDAPEEPIILCGSYYIVP